MKKFKILLLTLLFTVSCFFQFYLFSFNSYDEKLQAYDMALTISDINSRRALIRNILLGNIDTIEAVKNFISCLNSKNNEYYDSVEGLSGDDLKRSLHKIIVKHDSLGYSLARKMMYGLIDNNDDSVIGVYTGRVFPYKHINPRNTVEENSGLTRSFMNCEHTWPQSFFNKQEPMRSDIFHLFPSDSAANGVRGSYPFGVVEDVDWERNGSKRGLNKVGKMVFQPRPCHRGNVARAIFYFATCYSKKVDSAQEEVLRKWNKDDPVDDNERKRNESIYKLQHNRNPFIDHPEYVDMITDF